MIKRAFLALLLVFGFMMQALASAPIVSGAATFADADVIAAGMTLTPSKRVGLSDPPNTIIDANTKLLSSLYADDGKSAAASHIGFVCCRSSHQMKQGDRESFTHRKNINIAHNAWPDARAPPN